MNPNFTQLLTEIIALIVASGGITAVFGIGRKKKNKELIENTINYMHMALDSNHMKDANINLKNAMNAINIVLDRHKS